MTDNHTPKERSYNMSRIRSKGTVPEERVRKYLFSQGLRYRKNVRSLPGCPDIVLSKYKAVIFVHGCFWHMHNCGKFRWPSSNQAYWRTKILHNVERDERNEKELGSRGWTVLILWECEIKKDFEPLMKRTIEQIKKHRNSPIDPG